MFALFFTYYLLRGNEMKKDKKYEELRKLAETKLEEKGLLPFDFSSTEQFNELIHELHTHQIELELQNEDLRVSKEELQASRDKYSDLYDFSPIGYLTITSKGLISQANLTVAELLGTERSRLIKQPFSAFISEESQDAYYTYLKIVLNTNEKQVCELKLKNGLKDAEGFQARLESLVMEDASNKEKSIWISVSDISDYVRMMRELEKIQRLESLGQLGGGIAHDFNNLLTGILGNISLAMGESTEKHVQELLNDSLIATNKASALAKKLQVFAKGGDPIKKTQNISHLIRETARFTLSGANVECHLDIPDDLSPVDIDPSQISQVIGNLVLNSVHAMPDGGDLYISAKEVPLSQIKSLPLKGNKYLEIVIRDTGMGITPENLEKIFEPYFTTKKTGSGLGLAICFSIMINHNGFITVDSKIGEGTTFYIYLEASKEKIKSIMPTEDVKDKQIHGHVLIMDDEEIVRMVISKLLESVGLTSETARDGEEAIKLYKKNSKTDKKFDAVIMDLTIPGGMGGEEAIKKLLKFDPKAKVIVSSGYADNQVLANYQEHGFKAILPKPFTIEQFKKVFFEVMKD